ncbi:MAG TPA: sensor histidine kinase [Streptomyces sp.]|nr:sensor histidine kinase [Streptomyces sp.]
MRTRSVAFQHAFDVALAVGVTVSGCIAGSTFHPAGWARFDVWGYLLTCLVALPLAARRLAPMTVVAVSCAAYTVYLAVGYQPSLNYWAPVIALLSLAARRPLRVSAAGAALLAGVIVHSGAAGRLPGVLIVVQAVFVPALALIFGHTQHRLAQRTRELADTTAQLAREQEDRARRAVVDERVRIARELHDVVAHHMSVISVQAGLAAYVFTSDPATARTALAAIGDVSRDALDELRRLLSVLRVDLDGSDDLSPPMAPLPGLARIGELAERVGSTGASVRIRTTGVPRLLAPGLELCAYRVVQEALTNVVKHAGRARAEVHIDYGPDRLRITVSDDGVGGDPANSATDSGHGLIGMRERVRICGGDLTAGARSGGGFEVRLTLPADAAPAAEQGA